jgi:hypothetical protein
MSPLIPLDGQYNEMSLKEPGKHDPLNLEILQTGLPTFPIW